MRAPEGWRETTLGEHVEKMVGGGTPSKDNPLFWNGDIPWASVKDLKSSRLDGTIDSITKKGLEASASNVIPKGTVILATRMAVGKTVRFSQDVAINQDLRAIFPKPILDTEYLFWILGNYENYLQSVATGTTVKGIRQETLKALPILLPPLAEQRRIAEILSSMDDAIESAQAVIEQTRTVKQGVLNRLLTKGIGHTRFKKTETGTIPEKWTVAPLKTVAHVQTGAAKGKKDIDNPVELPYLRVANVQDGHIDLTTVKTITVSASQIERYSLQVGDVLMTEGGDFDKLGRGDVWRGQISPCLHQNHVFAVRPNPDVLMPEFLAILTGSSYGKSYFLSCAKQTTNLASINSTQVKDFPVLLPDRDEQEKIVAVVQALSKAEQSAQNSLEKTMNTKSALLSDLLTGRKRVPAALLTTAE